MFDINILQKGGYGTVSIIDNGEAYSWEVRPAGLLGLARPPPAPASQRGCRMGSMGWPRAPTHHPCAARNIQAMCIQTVAPLIRLPPRPSPLPEPPPPPPLQVDIFQAPLPTTIQLVLTTPGLPQLILLTKEPSDDGISFGTLEYDQVAQAVAASPNPSAKLFDGTM